MGLKFSHLFGEIFRCLLEIAYGAKTSFNIRENKFVLAISSSSYSDSDIFDGMERLEISVGLKELLIEKCFTVKLIIDFGCKKISQILQIDPYIAKIVVEEAQKVIKMSS